ncbi:response regulator [uncultured Magnetospirillum sp.]|uniref:response regulator transcription factor n=1 Tax=uncultured Magnetospirillum sp. TaxID=354119 RepID=UPI0026332B9F|nr:response regulator [uncultured Magnetospirillum sp.]
MQQEPPFVVAIVDDDAGFRDAIGWLLKANGYGVRGYADAPSFLAGHDPTVIGCVLLDLRLDDSCGIDTLVEARRRGLDAPVLMISGHGDIPTAVKAVKLGAAGFIEKPVDNDKLLATVETACTAHQQQCRQHGRAINALKGYGQLTSRERQVFWAITDGLTNKEIATTLGISIRTAETHRARVFEKMTAGSVGDLNRAAHFLPRPSLVNP